MKAKINVVAKCYPYIFFTLQLDSAWESWSWEWVVVMYTVNNHTM